MNAKLGEIFDFYGNEFEKLITSPTNCGTSYEFENGFNLIMKELGQDVFQNLIGKVPKSKNEHTTILTSMGDINFPKSHPLASAPGGFKISPYLQEQLCRVGTKMIFEEASEEVTRMMGIKVNAKQIERLCHHYGELLDQIDWKQAYKDSTQLCLAFENQVTYIMIDGSMILTRQKDESWKEVKLCRMFRESDRVENISKNRNYIIQSIYVAHLGQHDAFFEKVIDILPTQTPVVFICDGARWIWNWIDEHYPNSTQILDLYHCKQHLYAFALKYHSNDPKLSKKWVDTCIETLMEKKVDRLLTKLKQLQCKNRELEKEKEKLYNYLKNNEKRINYGLYKEQNLLFGSGAIESANRDIIQKRMKLSGQRWTLSGAQQMLNLRVCYKSGQDKKLKELITDHANAA
ncbi:MAG: UPF0236 family protein [Bacteroidota bacterium]